MSTPVSHTRNLHTCRGIAAVAILCSSALVPLVHANLNAVVDVNPDPNIFECDFTSVPKIVTIAGNTNVQAMVYRDNNAAVPPGSEGIPIPVIYLKTNEMVICRFKNELPAGACGCQDEGASIHWHGIELDNDSDGTGITQDSVLEGQRYTYRFKAPRPGVYWFHSHMMPGNATFAGMYGVLIITNGSEGGLIANGVLPPSNYTYTLAMSDIEFNAAGQVGRTAAIGTNPPVFKTMNQWELDCHNTRNKAICQAAAKPGTNVLVNGQNPDTTPAPMTFDVPSGQRIRLRLLNEALVRYFRVRLLSETNTQINLFRVGGQGGLLNNARLEGGIRGTNAAATNNWDTGYDQGEIVLGSGDRADVIALVTGTNGAILKLVGNPLPDSPFKLSAATLENDPAKPNIRSNYPIAFFRIVGSNAPANPAPTNGAPILAGYPDAVPQLGAATGSLVDPATLGRPGTASDVIRLTTASSAPGIDGVDGHILDGNSGDGAITNVPHLASSRYARVGDLLELSVRNETTPVHPFHLHGFSFQPVKILRTDDTSTNTVYNFDYNEFFDTLDVYPGDTLVFRINLEDREKFCDQSPTATATNGPVLLPCGESSCDGAVGRWAYHCHIFPHAGDGMISELVVLSDHTEFNVKATDPKVLADDFYCTNTGPVLTARVRGSWRDDKVSGTPCFHLGLWTDVPAFGTNYSRPGQPLCSYYFNSGQYTSAQYTNGVDGAFFDPNIPALIGCESNVWEYVFTFPTNTPCVLTNGSIYWLSLTADCFNTNQYMFGWQATTNHWNDDAVFGDAPFFGFQPSSWQELREPPGYTNSLDLSFDITMDTNSPPEPTNCLIVISCPIDETVVCGSGWTNSVPAVFDSCCGTNYSLTYTAFTNGICPQFITYFWTYINCLGSNAYCSQMVTVMDTTPPLLVCASNKTASCDSAWDFDPPAASDDCCDTNVTVTVLNTFSNGVCPQFFTRTWQATDCCGNSTSCSQTVTVIDTNPPSITCPTNIILLTCSSNAAYPWFISATDTCSSVTVDSTPPPGTLFDQDTTNTVIATATDACGNTNTCSFLVIVRRPALNITISGSLGNVVLTWSDSGVLQESTSLLGSWTDLPTATSPYTTAAAGSRKFYRLRCQ